MLACEIPYDYTFNWWSNNEINIPLACKQYANTLVGPQCLLHECP